MPALFVASWTTLRGLENEAARAFVWSAVLAQVAHLYAGMPVSVFRQRQVFGRAGRAMRIAVVVFLAMFAVQIWFADPVVTQRLLTAVCTIYLCSLLLGHHGDRQLWIGSFRSVIGGIFRWNFAGICFGSMR